MLLIGYLVIRESEEEASLPADLVRQEAKYEGTLTYIYIRESRAGGENDLLQPECTFPPNPFFLLN